jgi:hypothetical protein
MEAGSREHDAIEVRDREADWRAGGLLAQHATRP